MARSQPHTWRNTELLYPAVWLLYLVFPLGACLTADASIVTRAITSVLVIAFGVVYLSVYRYAHVFDNSELKLWGVTGILIALAAGTYPVTGILFVCFIPYFCALWVFIQPGRRGIINRRLSINGPGHLRPPRLTGASRGGSAYRSCRRRRHRDHYWGGRR